MANFHCYVSSPEGNMHLSMSTRVSRAIWRSTNRITNLLWLLRPPFFYLNMSSDFFGYTTVIASKPIMTLLAWTYQRSKNLVLFANGWPKGPQVWLKNGHFETSSGCWLHWIILGFHWRYPLRHHRTIGHRPWQGRHGLTQPCKMIPWHREKRCTLWWTNILLWKITIFNGKIHYKWPFSIAMLVHQRVSHLVTKKTVSRNRSTFRSPSFWQTKPCRKTNSSFYRIQMI